jgi:hypothetical protein
LSKPFNLALVAAASTGYESPERLRVGVIINPSGSEDELLFELARVVAANVVRTSSPSNIGCETARRGSHATEFGWRSAEGT